MDFSNKGKSLTNSVPSMAIRFNATAEEIEEVYPKEDEQNEIANENVLPVGVEKSIEVETSPRRSILPLLGKRSTSVDVNATNAQDSSPPSDPWRFLSDIKGKITKSVEVKFTEYKARTIENEGSPKILKPVKDSKENSSLSDSEEASESSISRTCGVVSTTEGVEMSSDDETPSLSEEEKQQQQQQNREKDRDNGQPNQSPSSSSIRQRFRVTGQGKEGALGGEFLENIQKITEGVPGSDTTEIESGVDVLADLNVSNFDVDDDNVLNISQVRGSDIRSVEFSGSEGFETVFSPLGFVDLRRSDVEHFNWLNTAFRHKPVVLTLFALWLYFFLPLSVYASGFIAGGLVISLAWAVYLKVCFEPLPLKVATSSVPIVEIPAVKEHQPLVKYEGWVNEYPEEYNPFTYHVSQTQPVYLRLQGNFLKVSHTRQKIPKRAMWNEPEHKFVFTRHRIYNLSGAKVNLLPEGLARVRHWSKKYPICVTLNKDMMNVEEPVKKVKEHKGKEVKVQEKKSDSMVEVHSVHDSKEPIVKDRSVTSQMSSVDSVMQIFSKLIDDVDEQEHGSFHVQQSESDDIFNPDDLEDFDVGSAIVEEEEEEFSVCCDEWHDVIGPVQISPDETRLYLFGRTGREKEDWFRRLRVAANRQAEEDSPTLYDEYLTYMKTQKCFFTEEKEPNKKDRHCVIDHQGCAENVWLNSLIARVLFDCMREPQVNQRIKERIQRKLASVRLPHFIQELHCEELNLGTSAPLILGSGKPVLNDRGLWVDLDISYEGLFAVILQTKVNLMKLKTEHIAQKIAMDRLVDDKPAIYHSDVDDSAESTTDDETIQPTRSNASTKQALDSMGYPLPGMGGSSKGSKKFMKMVDKIAESKFFQAATENKYIKKAMQEFSNTDLRLKVEVKKCVGKLVINIPPPPSDRIWLGFRVPPELLISAHPIVGDRNISFMRVTSWIEKKIYKEFQKVFVIPNMEDLLIPVMSTKLPE